MGRRPIKYNQCGDLEIVVGSDTSHFDNGLIWCNEPSTTDEPTVINTVYVIDDTRKKDIKGIIEVLNVDPLQGTDAESIFTGGAVTKYERKDQLSFSEACRGRNRKTGRTGEGNLGDNEGLQGRERSPSETEGTLPDDGVKLSLRDSSYISAVERRHENRTAYGG